MEHKPINQRIKFLIDQMGISARAFSDIIDESPTNTHNYTGKRNSMPSADYLEKIILHFEGVNPRWLLTGQGEPFLSSHPTMRTSSKNDIKKIRGNVQANTVNNIYLEACQKALAAAKAENKVLKDQIVSRDALLANKDVLLAAKDETITLLRASYTRPN